MTHAAYREIEVRFLDIDKKSLEKKLHELAAEDKGEDFLEESIFCDAAHTWHDEKKFVRLRKSAGGIFITFKQRKEYTATGTREVEIRVDNFEHARVLLEDIGLVEYRTQEKRRHTFVLDGVTVDIDTWPSVPTFMELEGESEDALRQMAEKLGFNWAKVVTEPPSVVINKYYHIPIFKLRYFTFDKIE